MHRSSQCAVPCATHADRAGGECCSPEKGNRNLNAPERSLRRDAITAVTSQMVSLRDGHSQTSIAAPGMIDLTSSILEGTGPC